jgi:hypothetical protein
MRPGIAISVVGHILAVWLTWVSWPIVSELPSMGAQIVPVEIVNIGAETNVRALAEEVPDDEVAPQEEEQSQEEPAPAPSPTPQQRREQARDDEFNLADISGMIDRQRNQGRRRQEGAPADRNQRGAGLGTEERASIESRVASLMDRHLRRCWRSTADMPDPERLVVTVEVQLDRNGRLVGQPRVISPSNYTFDPLMNEAVNRALRAVRVCDPYEFLPSDPAVGEHFDIWRRQEVRFGLRQQ